MLSEAKKGLCCCHSAGWWNAVFAERRASNAPQGNYERLASTLTCMHWLAFATLMLASLFGNS
jgi:hypothetical protein